MTTFRRKGLGILERLYRFTSAVKAPSTVELESGIQLVHDVSREVELASYTRNEGYFVYSQTVTHAGGGALYQSRDMYFQATSRSDYGVGEDTEKDDISLWLIDYSAWSDDASDNTNYAVSLNYDANSGGIPLHVAEIIVPIFAWDAATGATRDFPNFAFNDTEQQLLNELSASQLPSLPYPVFNGVRLNTYSFAGAAVEVRIHTLWWVGRRGTTPPGMR